MTANTSPWTLLDEYVPALFDGLDREISQMSKDTGLLADGVADQVRAHRADDWICRNRLFATAVLGSQGEDPLLALPVSIVSLLWWAGAEALDDLADGYSSGGISGTMLAAMPASISNLLVLPLDCIEGQDVTPELKSLWRRELLWSCRLAAEGQLADANSPDIVDRAQVLACYRGKTGAAYARDAVMAAAIDRNDLTRDRPLELWREFGMLYGILRQLHNDNSGAAATDNEDLANYTPTLRLFHAFSTSRPAQRRQLVWLRQAARTDPGARHELHDLLSSETVTASYHQDLRSIHHEACTLLDSLSADGPHRNALRAGLDVATICAMQAHTPTAQPS